jgi:hypothetical protein
VPQRIYTFVVDQQVKGDIGRTVDVRIPERAANGGSDIRGRRRGRTRKPGRWCLLHDPLRHHGPGAVLAEVDEPRGMRSSSSSACSFSGGARLLDPACAPEAGSAGRGSLAP